MDLLKALNGPSNPANTFETTTEEELRTLADKLTELCTKVARVEFTYDQVQEILKAGANAAQRITDLEHKIAQLEEDKTSLEAKIVELETEKVATDADASPLVAIENQIRQLEARQRSGKFEFLETNKVLEDKLHEAKRERMRLRVKLGVNGIEPDEEGPSKKRKVSDTDSENMSGEIDEDGVKRGRGRSSKVSGSWGDSALSSLLDGDIGKASRGRPRGRPRGRGRGLP